MTTPTAPINFGEGPALVDEPTAINHLRLATPLAPERAADLTFKIQAASNQIRQKLQDHADPDWDDTTAPFLVRAAVLIYLGAIWQNLGDDETRDAIAKAWTTIGSLLALSNGPVVS